MNLSRLTEGDQGDSRKGGIPLKTLYIIGGTMGVGKTTTCQHLKKILPESVFLDGDWCWDSHPFQVTEETRHMVMDNICYGKLDATDEECIKAAKLANAHDFITRLPQGYQTVLTGNGASLSQGQRQLIAIARAAVADPPVMILDEATSSIDTRTELKIQNAFAALMKGRTSFIVAHRLSTIKEADIILVMKDGHIIEQGNHKTLLAAGGFYANLYNSQFEN